MKKTFNDFVEESRKELEIINFFDTKKITKLKGELIIDDLVKVRFVPLLEGKENKWKI